MPHPGTGGQGGQGEGGEGEDFIHGGNEDLSLVVGGDQNTCSSVISSEDIDLTLTTFVGFITEFSLRTLPTQPGVRSVGQYPLTQCLDLEWEPPQW